jgi:deoxyribodipyrimidine photo-lyase
MRGIVWFRRDLRLNDQPALAAACAECDEVIPLFVFDEPLLQSHVFGSACVNFMLGCLDDVSASLAVRGLTLQWRRGEPVEEVIQVARAWKADAVYWNRDYDPGAIERDRAVQQRLAKIGVIVRTFKDHVVFETEEVRGATGEPMQRYSAYRTRWWTKWQSVKPTLLPIPHLLTAEKAASLPVLAPLPSPSDLGYEPIALSIEPGERNAQKRLRRFIDGPIHSYITRRNLPDVDGSSILSPHFRFGTLSVRAAVHTALASLAQGGRVSRPDVFAWVDELVWREFFQQILAAFPRVVDGPFRQVPATAPRAPGAERDRLYQAWCEGKTGFPIVDAGMRQLNQTGWMHNRVRMVVASFLIKDLRIDWQSGERYFMQRLMDADVAANNGNWQWCASTGTDAMRGYRIFNPLLQSKKFDPKGAYIRRYVRELVKVPLAAIHEPRTMTVKDQERSCCRIGLDYPAPIVDHQQARQDYLDLGKAATVART